MLQKSNCFIIKQKEWIRIGSINCISMLSMISYTYIAYVSYWFVQNSCHKTLGGIRVGPKQASSRRFCMVIWMWESSLTVPIEPATLVIFLTLKILIVGDKMRQTEIGTKSEGQLNFSKLLLYLQCLCSS